MADTEKVFTREPNTLDYIKSPSMFYDDPRNRHIHHMSFSEIDVSFWRDFFWVMTFWKKKTRMSGKRPNQPSRVDKWHDQHFPPYRFIDAPQGTALSRESYTAGRFKTLKLKTTEMESVSEHI